jgi:thioredoxin reductase
VQTNLFATNHKVFDAIIVGGGPAGIACALELSFCNVQSLLIDKGSRLGGQLLDIKCELMNFAAGNFKSGLELAAVLQKQVTARQHANILRLQERTVTGIEPGQPELSVLVDGDVYKTRTIVLCTGYRVRRLTIPGTAQFQDDIFYAENAHTHSPQPDRVAVLGSGDSALVAALALAPKAERVYLLNRSKRWRTRSEFLEQARNHAHIEIIENVDLLSLTGTAKMTGAHLSDKTTNRVRNLSFARLFVKIGYAPNTEIFKNQIELNDTGHVQVDGKGRTNVAGIFAAGDIIPAELPRVATACGSGAVAAQSVMFYLGKRLC